MVGSPSQIADALVAVLQAALGASYVRRDDYEILARRNPWAVIVSLESGRLDPHQLGGEFRAQWVFRVQLFVPTAEKGPPPVRRVTDGIESIVNAILGNQTLNGTVKRVNGLLIQHEPGSVLGIGGQAWLTAAIRVETLVF